MKIIYRKAALILALTLLFSCFSSCTYTEEGGAQKLSAGLDMQLSADGGSYSVCGIGECADLEILIGGIYEGKPVKSIGGYAFWGCGEIREAFIFESIEHIGNDAFSYCVSLKQITLPATLKSIGDYAFYGCSSLFDMYFSGTAEEWRAIEKGEEWRAAAALFVIHCSDYSLTWDENIME